MKPALSSAVEEQTRTFLSELLMNVPIMRAQGTPEQFLEYLHRAILFYPVFLNWPSPVDGWLAEAEQICRDLTKLDTLADIMLRRATVHMRRLEYAAALAELERVRQSVSHLSAAQQAWHAVIRGRVLTRQHQFDEARRALSAIASPPEGWTAALPLVARGELELEANEVDAAGKTLQLALSTLPFELVEERVQVLQSIAFVFITQANPPKAQEYLDQARQILRGAGAWADVVQMNLAVGSFQVSAGNQAAAQALFTEAIELSRQYPQPQLEPLVRVALARSQAASGKVDEAVGAVLQAARLYAEQSNIIGFVSMIVLIANMYVQDKNYAEAYRMLATGIAIAKHHDWSVVQDVLRRHVNRLRDDVMGPARFDAMVQDMIDRSKKHQ